MHQLECCRDAPCWHRAGSSFSKCQPHSLHSFCILSTLASLRPFMLFKSLLLLCARASTECTPLSFSFLMSAAAMPNSCDVTQQARLQRNHIAYSSRDTPQTQPQVTPGAFLWEWRSLEVPPLLPASGAPRTLPCLWTPLAVTNEAAWY